MNDALITFMPSPVRANFADNQAEILGFAIEAAQNGGSALATLVEIRGGAARALGAHVAVASDGRYCGYVSGGCVEAAVAAEALEALAEKRDRIVKFGEGSPFFDIALPCGGGITIAIHVLRDTDVLKDALGDLARRKSLALGYRPETESLERIDEIPARSGWRGKDFVCVYRPVTRVVISGQTGEAEAIRRLAEASGYDLTLVGPGASSQVSAIDACTAVVLLHHDLNLEDDLLRRALLSPAFYIGALGSTRTHRRRLDRLKSIGMPSEAFDRIKAPIGLFGPTRDSTSLAISILADVAAARSETYA